MNIRTGHGLPSDLEEEKRQGPNRQKKRQGLERDRDRRRELTGGLLCSEKTLTSELNMSVFPLILEKRRDRDRIRQRERQGLNRDRDNKRELTGGLLCSRKT